MPTSEETLETLVDDISALTHLVNLNDDPATAALAARSTELAALSPLAADLQASADARDNIVAAASNATAAEAARDAAQAAASVTPDTAVGASTLENAIRARYKVSGRHPSIIVDPIDDVYFSPTGAKSFDDLITYYRSDSASFTDGSGLTKWAGANTPRTNHHVFKDGVWQPAGLRVDPESTNLIEDSENFTGGTWLKSNLTVTPDATVAPDGNTAATQIEATSTAVARLRNQIGGLSEDSPVTYSVFLKAGTGQYAQMLFNDLGGTSAVWFNLGTGIVENTDGDITASAIRDAGNGWYRCSMTKIVPADDSGEVEIRLVNSTAGSSSTPGESQYVWGAQFELSGTQTSYIKSSGAQVTRAADGISISSGLIPPTLNGFTIIIDVNMDWVDVGRTVPTELFDWSANNPTRILRIQLLQHASFVSKIRSTAFVDTSFVSENPTSDSGIGQGLARPLSIALRVTPSDIQTIANGNAYNSTQLSNGIPDPSQATAHLLKEFTGTLTRLRIFDVGLSEADLIQETTLQSL